MEENSNSANPINAEQRILELCAQNPDGISDSMLQQEIPQISAQQRLAALNRLLSLGRLDLLKSAQLGIVYRLKDKLALSSALSTSGDMDEKLVFAVIKESGNKGIWIRDISTKTNVKSTALNKTLKNLESKKLIKSVQSVNANKKKVYMLYDLEPDRSVTGGAWYSGKEFESEFVEILNEQCYHFLVQRKEQIDEKFPHDPVMRRASSFVSSKEIRDYIKNLGISRVELTTEDIETILNTLVFDGKCERTVTTKQNEQIGLYRATNFVIEPKKGSSLIRLPCGICPLIDNCHIDSIINPQQCVYMKEWLDF
ncbi:DNA-directed RNA polymerase III subunit RPC6 isoform X2 [Brachionus plicatilis]|uniref:DNA-directed RNA polymerase III subunit RPC6 n=1 Tax=Brachionus plicatilis TaxID=10195 RepID=A0A3M7S767_BRAPC|nr:DNA-directed RNA polymerase III subunit RPC6 isoform X2 [Brachionus plicatilis]